MALPTAMPTHAGITFQGTGWKLLEVPATEKMNIFAWAPDEGYYVFLDAVFSADGEFLLGSPNHYPDNWPGVYLDAEYAGAALTPTLRMGSYGGTFATVPPWDMAPGTYYVLMGVAGEVSHWMLDADPSWIIASGDAHLAWGYDMEGGMFAEANVGIVSASTGTQERTLTINVNDTLVGSFGWPAFAFVGGTSYQEGNATLIEPDGTRRTCPCAYSMGGYFPGPGQYTFSDERTMVTQLRMPPAVWADVPLSMIR